MEDFEEKLVVVEYLHDTFGADSFEDFRDALNEVEEGFKADNRSRFKERLISELDPTDWLRERMDEYDQNVGEYERRLNENRDDAIQLKYYQYLSLLFAEIYLDLYYNYREKLERELGGVIEDKRTELDAEDLYPLDEGNLGRIAYWMATGSGKTLIMHANLWQFHRYADQEPENVLLITPNSGLTEQHLTEFEESGIDAEAFGTDGVHTEDLGYAGDSSSVPTVGVLDIHKLREEGGEKTFPVDLFEGDNLVFVDEGHKGAQGDTHIDYRERVIGDDGFSFEYSATFGQALSSIDNEQLQNRYVKSILFDYSFRNFHVDGFGKEYDILNLADDDRTRRDKYLTANLLSFYEQKKYFTENTARLEEFNLEDPLWIFVGQTVNAVRGRELTREDKVSDVEEVVRFLDRVLGEPEAVIGEIDDILSGSEFLDENGTPLFEDRFGYLKSAAVTPEEMYREMMDLVFNAAADAELNVVRLNDADGEIGLRVGRTEHYFGLINIGKGTTRRFVDRIEENTDIAVEKQEFRGSVFSELNEGDSDINVLIGAKRFTEGWDSYRVASMGLLGVGRTEGAEIIQIFGRGIRLRGKDHSLKRTSYLGLPESEVPDGIEILERLNVFGIKADYIKEFEEQLEKENIPAGFVTKSLRTDVDADLLDGDLKVPRKTDEATYAEETVTSLRVSEAHGPIVDLYPEVQTLRSDSSIGLSEEKNRVTSAELHTEVVDWDRMLVDMVEYKRRKGYSNLIVNESALRSVVLNDEFGLYCPERRLNSDTPVERKEQTEEIVRIVLRSYIDNLYAAEKSDWEDRRREYQRLAADDPELNFDLNFRVPDDDDLVAEVTELIDDATATDNEYTLGFDRSLYRPLLIKERIEDRDPETRLRAPAESLNEDERRLVERLEALCRRGTISEDTVYLLRNPSGRGIGFEQGGYPDFLLWVKTGTEQKLIFLDPHGMIWEPAAVENADKVKLSERIDGLEERLDDPTVEMHSYVISVTDEETLAERFEDFSVEHYERNNVYLQNTKGGRGYVERILLDAGVTLE
ncbi:DEAD/DEAH box helicase family protein [Halobaculum sp. CBA1158]|uniref:DEAD/DEAH box helicase family protein n=1 Tax=Halobaculum sp. CBA1158 TaxID=2904243 RepID=UPI001F41D0F0|nr:DEAD/DEAH box helicase family protein [Halobaculum sp. CBA1158]UIO99356.1 DEAD/DEAH box helicase family protein [Halobaculum sp. CBA1158]